MSEALGRSLLPKGRYPTPRQRSRLERRRVTRARRGAAPTQPLLPLDLEQRARPRRAQGEEEDHPGGDGHDPHLAPNDREGDRSLALARQRLERQVAQLALRRAGARALGEERDDERPEPVDVMEPLHGLAAEQQQDRSEEDLDDDGDL